MATFGGLLLELAGSGIVLLTSQQLKHTRTYKSRTGELRTKFGGFARCPVQVS